MVAYAHSRGVIHRDLKPANILLGPYGETLVVDWGLAKVVGRGEAAARAGAAEATLQPGSGSGSSETLPGTALGTPAYMSPEQAEGRLEQVGPLSDVYSLGATLYCLLTGKPPIDETDVGEALRRVQRGEFPPPRAVRPGIPQGLEAICLKAMALKPEERYPSARALADEIEHWLADEPVSVYREPITVRLTRWGRRHRTLATSLGVLLVTAVVGLAIATALIRGEQLRTEQQRRDRRSKGRRAEAERTTSAASTSHSASASATTSPEPWSCSTAAPRISGAGSGITPGASATSIWAPFANPGRRSTAWRSAPTARGSPPCRGRSCSTSRP